jgi:hypothetical protein
LDELVASQHRVAVYALNAKEDEMRRVGVTIVRDAEHIDNTRIKNQRGLFTLLPSNRPTLDECFEKQSGSRRSPPKTLAVKFSLPYSDATLAIRDLELMDISARRIYNDWTGVCSAANMICWLDLNSSPLAKGPT